MSGTGGKKESAGFAPSTDDGRALHADKHGFARVVVCPPICPDCGYRRHAHRWGCGVAVRLCAKMFAGLIPDWRGYATGLAERAAVRDGGLWTPEAEHWRAVLSEPDQPGGSTITILTYLYPAADGSCLLESSDPPDRLNLPGGDAVLESIQNGLMMVKLLSLFPGTEVAPPAYPERYHEPEPDDVW